MNRLKLGAIAALIAIAGAVSVKASSLARQTYYWFTLDAAGNPANFVPGADEEAPTGCEAGTIPCAKAYSLSQVQPTAGGGYTVRPGQEHQAQITAMKLQ